MPTLRRERRINDELFREEQAFVMKSTLNFSFPQSNITYPHANIDVAVSIYVGDGIIFCVQINIIHHNTAESKHRILYLYIFTADSVKTPTGYNVLPTFVC